MIRHLRLRRSVTAVIGVVLLAGCHKKKPAPPPDTATHGASQTTGSATTGKNAKVAAGSATGGTNGANGLGPGTDAQKDLLVKAKSAFLNEQWDQAEKLFKQLTETGPLSGPQVTATIALGQIYNDSDRGPEAEKLYQNLLAKAPDVPEVHFVMGRTLAEQKQFEKAIHQYELTIKLQPDYLQAMVELAGLYKQTGKKSESEKLYYRYEQKVYALAKELESPDTKPPEKLHILDIFSFVNDDRANQAVAKAVLDKNPDVREQAILLAADLHLGAVRPALKVLATGDPDRRVRLAAEQALKALKGAPEAGAKPTVVEPKAPAKPQKNEAAKKAPPTK